MRGERERLGIHLDDVGYTGECVGRTDGMVVFAAFGLPGEDVVVEVDERKRRYARGRVVEVLNASPGRVAAPCPLFGTCGGCEWQHVDYAVEVAYKERIVGEHLRRLGGFSDPPIRPILRAASPWRYRNQGRFSHRNGVLGFTRRHSRAVLEVEDCLLMQEPIVAIIARLQGRVPRLHQVVIRHGARTGSSLVAPHVPDVPDVETGQPFYEETLLTRRFRVSAYSFFQASTLPAARPVPESVGPVSPEILPTDGLSQADLLALVVLDRLALTGAESVLDAYSGVGTFTLLAAERARRVIGIEEARSATADAEHNARDAGNVQLLTGRVEAVLPQVDVRLDAAILDPSRVGCAPGALAALLAIRPPRVVYVSCDPATLARDLKALCESAYDLVDVQPIDMFPRTHHVEVVATLAARRSGLLGPSR